MKMNSRLLSLIAATVLSMNTFAVSIETDRTWYLAGEAMKVRVTTEDATIAYAELCDKYSLAAGTILRLNGGTGEGIIELPADLHSGYYLLSVYTRNDTNVSQQLVAVVNSLHKSEDDDIQWVEITQSKTYSQALQTHPQPLPVEGGEKNVEGVNTPLPQQGGVGGGSGGLDGSDGSELEGHIIKARVRNVYEGRTFKGSDILPSLSIIGKQIHYFEGKMVSDTMAVFHTFGIHGSLPLVLSATSSTGVSLPIEMISPFATLLPRELPHLVFHYNRSEVEARSLDMQRHQRTKDEGQPSILDYDDTVFGTKPYLTYNLDEYRQFHTIREVLLEYVSCVSTMRHNGLLQLIVRREFYNSSPSLVLIDGMPVLDTERLLKYDARRVHHINVYDGQYNFGNGVYNGILSFVTRSGQLTNYPTERNTQYLVYDFP